MNFQNLQIQAHEAVRHPERFSDESLYKLRDACKISGIQIWRQLHLIVTQRKEANKLLENRVKIVIKWKDLIENIIPLQIKVGTRQVVITGFSLDEGRFWGHDVMFPNRKIDFDPHLVDYSLSRRIKK